MVEGESAERVKSFTAALWVIGGLCSLCLAPVAPLAFVLSAYSLLITGEPATLGVMIFFGPMIMVLQIVLALMCFWAAALRSVGASVAGTATSATSFLLAIWFPLGTAAFLWWWFSVRKREAGLAAA